MVHALALSTSQLVESGRVGSTEGWRIIVVALLSNLVFKGAAVTMLGARHLSRKVALPYVLTMAVGIGIVLLWH
jgi:hypothetical protein